MTGTHILGIRLGGASNDCDTEFVGFTRSRSLFAELLLEAWESHVDAPTQG